MSLIIPDEYYEASDSPAPQLKRDDKVQKLTGFHRQPRLLRD